MNQSLRVAIVMLLAVLGCGSPRVALRAPTVADTSGYAAAVVRIQRPWFAPRFVVRSRFKGALPEFDANNDIVAKYFSIADDGRFGGLYVWSSREAAERHFDQAWRADVRKRRGVDPDVVILAAPIVVDGPAVPLGDPIGRRSLEYPGAATFVRWTLSARASPSQIRMVADTLAAEPSLARAFVVAEGLTLGALVLWVTRDAADRATTKERLGLIAGAIGGGDADVVRFETPLLVDESLRRAATIANHNLTLRHRADSF